jgi:hypothetical protein
MEYFDPYQVRDQLIADWQREWLDRDQPEITAPALVRSADRLISRILSVTHHQFGDVQTIQPVMLALVQVAQARL